MTPAERLAALRAKLAEAGVSGFLVPRADEHLGEYVPASAERLAWLTGFTGSAGLAIVLADRAAVFTDGRYTLQVTQQTDPDLWERRHLTEEPPADWLREHAAGRRIGFDPWLHAEPALARFEVAGVTLVPLASNPLDAVWAAARPAPPASPLRVHGAEFAGGDAAAKRSDLAATLREADEAAVVLADPSSVAWLLNIRGQDVPYTPLPLSFAVVDADGAVDLFLDPGRADAAVRTHLGNAVRLRPREELPAALDALKGRVRVDADATPAWIARRLRAAGATVSPGEDPCRMPRACKNPVEREGARRAHRRDAAAMARFLAWFAAEAPKGGLSEIAAAERLIAFRAADPLFRGESFPAISGAGEHGAIVHYRATEASNRGIAANECYLIDSGAQYPDGTTDITRTLWTGPGAPAALLRARVTRVLRGHIALATLRFPEGVSGPHLDGIARRPLWDAGEDYDHGTGHGVGSYLSVHEGPVAFSRAARQVPLREGMILSDEPGFYAAGEYGIRQENLLLVKRAEVPGARKMFLEFETLTLAPFDRRLIDPALLTPAEHAWIDAYHARVLAEVAPQVEGPIADWLRAACAPL